MRFFRYLQVRPRGERLLVALLALIATYGLFHEYLPPFTRVHLWSDAAGYHYPLQGYAFHSLKDGHLPLWDPSMYSGITLVGNVQAALLYPPTWLLYAAAWRAPRLTFKAYEAFVFLHVWMAFLLAYLWLRRRCGILAGVLGAAVFSWTGYMIYQVLHPGVVGAMTWMPLALWGVDEAAGRGDWRPLWKVAAASALSFLAGYPASWIVVCVAVFTYALGARGRWRTAAGVFVALLGSALLFMLQLLPTVDARSYMRLEPKYGPGAYSLVDLLRAFFVSNWFDFNPGHPAYFDPGCMYLYLGLPALFAIAWAVWRHRIRPYLQPALVLAVALLLANPPQFLIRAVAAIPALNDTMQPYNFYAAVAAMAALISAIGLNDFLQSRSARTVPAWLSYGAAIALAIWSGRQLRIWHRGGMFPTGTRAVVQTAIALALFSLFLWCVRQAAGRRRTVLAAILLFAAAADYHAHGSGRWFNAQKGDLDGEYPPYGIPGIDDDAYRAMRANRQYRAVFDDTSGTGDTIFRLWGLATPQGFDPFLSQQYIQAIRHWVPFQTNRTFRTDVFNEDMLETLGVRYVLVRGGFEDVPRLAASPNFRLVGRKAVFCRVYEYLHARAPYRWEDASGGGATPVAWMPERREFKVRSETGGRFVLIEQFFPGWRATADGHPVEIERWGGAFQAIRLPAGEHRVRFEFRPPSLQIGAAVSLIAFGALLLLVRADWRSRRRTAGVSRPEPAGICDPPGATIPK
ncbi:MAG TPA: YfhO family protein [Bryobacteraceae bacterium]|nr:YfhO family protein [Bryobacteraceae bacterium]